MFGSILTFFPQVAPIFVQIPHKKAPDASRTRGFKLFCISAPQGYGDFCLMGNDKPQPHFIFCLQQHVCGLKPRIVLRGA